MPDMYDDAPQEMSNQQKAAILFITLGPEYSAKIFQHMADDEIEKITLEIASQKQVTPEQKRLVISEFYQISPPAVWNTLRTSWKRRWDRRRRPASSAV